MSDFVFMYTTFPDEDVAALTARALVDEQVVACANIIPGMRSVYRYEGQVEEGREVVVILKLPAANKDDAADALRARHPYETPVLAFFEIEPDAATAAWLRAVTRM